MELLVLGFQLSHFLLRCRPTDRRCLQLFYLLHCNALDGTCQCFLRPDRVQVNPHALRRLEPPYSLSESLFLLLQHSHVLLRCCHLFLNGLQSLRRRPVLRQVHVGTATAQADDLELMRLSDLRKGRFLPLHPGSPFRLLAAQAFKALLL